MIRGFNGRIEDLFFFGVEFVEVCIFIMYVEITYGHIKGLKGGNYIAWIDR